MYVYVCARESVYVCMCAYKHMMYVCMHVRMYMYVRTVRDREIGTGISEASKRIPIFFHDVRGGKQVSSYCGQELRQTQGIWNEALGAWQGSDPAATIVA